MFQTNFSGHNKFWGGAQKHFEGYFLQTFPPGYRPAPRVYSSLTFKSSLKVFISSKSGYAMFSSHAPQQLLIWSQRRNIPVENAHVSKDQA